MNENVLSEENINTISSNIANFLLPQMLKILESQKDFNYFFSYIKKIIWINDCNIISESKPNKETEDGQYPNQNILKIIYKETQILFDLNEGGLLDPSFKIISNTGTVTELFSIVEYEEESYSLDDLQHIYQKMDKKRSILQSIKFQRVRDTKEIFEKYLKEVHHIQHSNDSFYIEENNYRLFIDVDFEHHDVIFSNNIQFFIDGEWQLPFNIEEKMIDLISKENEKEMESE